MERSSRKNRSKVFYINLVIIYWVVGGHLLRRRDWKKISFRFGRLNLEFCLGLVEVPPRYSSVSVK